MDPHLLGMASRATSAIANSKERVDSTRGVLRASSHVIWSSWRTLLGQRVPICGGTSDGNMVSSIRERIREGVLPLVDGNVSAQLGTGHVCVICGDSIRVPEVEYLPDQTSGLRAHPPCYTLWLVESERAKRRPPAPRVTAPASRGQAMARQPEPSGE